jgi:hypothetical protein
MVAEFLVYNRTKPTLTTPEVEIEVEEQSFFQPGFSPLFIAIMKITNLFTKRKRGGKLEASWGSNRMCYTSPSKCPLWDENLLPPSTLSQLN